MNRKQGFTPIIIALIATLLLGGGFAVYKMSQNSWKTYSDSNKFYTFQYPAYATIEETKSVISDTTIILTKNWGVTFDVTTSPSDAGYCNSNPYESISKITSKLNVSEDKISKYGNEYRRLTVEDKSAGSSILEEERLYIVKNNYCYMIVERVMDIDKTDPKIKADLGKILSTFKFTK